jgi:hypothetical protein
MTVIRQSVDLTSVGSTSPRMWECAITFPVILYPYDCHSPVSWSYKCEIHFTSNVRVCNYISCLNVPIWLSFANQLILQVWESTSPRMCRFLSRENSGSTLLRELSAYPMSVLHGRQAVCGMLAVCVTASSDKARGNEKWVCTDRLVRLPVVSALRPLRAICKEEVPVTWGYSYVCVCALCHCTLYNQRA